MHLRSPSHHPSSRSINPSIHQSVKCDPSLALFALTYHMYPLHQVHTYPLPSLFCTENRRVMPFTFLPFYLLPFAPSFPSSRQVICMYRTSSGDQGPRQRFLAVAVAVAVAATTVHMYVASGLGSWEVGKLRALGSRALMFRNLHTRTYGVLRFFMLHAP
ncbi:hypothetical protein BZA77DRAFT_313082 [Pyronema omphalodes]|nr:hypothetical protein BZA77DRAFT_313082 [Pyronema omphalodes]